MNIEGVIWLTNIIDKLAVKHRVETYEVEEILENKPRFRFIVKGENVYMALGRTQAGRNLVVLYIYKTTKEALILSARDMAKKERKMYDRK